jgi:hypothetical protein
VVKGSIDRQDHTIVDLAALLPVKSYEVFVRAGIEERELGQCIAKSRHTYVTRAQGTLAIKKQVATGALYTHLSAPSTPTKAEPVASTLFSTLSGFLPKHVASHVKR